MTLRELKKEMQRRLNLINYVERMDLDYHGEVKRLTEGYEQLRKQYYEKCAYYISEITLCRELLRETKQESTKSSIEIYLNKLMEGLDK